MPEIGELLGKGYKMTELGPLPEEWDFLKLKETCLPRKEIIEPRDAISKFYIGLEHIISGKFKINHWGEPKEVKSTKNIFKKGDILYGKLRPYLNKIVYANVEGICSTDIIVLTPKKEKALSTYLAYYLYSKKFLEFATRTMTGVNHPRTSWSKLEDFLIPLPPLPEQQKIAAVLSAVQEAKEKTEAVIRAAKELKKSLMKYLFTYGPVPVDEAEKVRLKQTEIGLVPEEWEMIQVNNIFKLTSGKTRPRKLTSIETDDFKFPVFGGNGIMGYSNDYLIDFQTIVLGRVGEYCGSVHLSEAKSWISDNALYVKKFIRKDLNISYLALVLDLLNLNRLKKKSGQPLITQSIVYSQFIPFPPISIQEKLVNFFALMNIKIKSEESKKQALEALFKSLLNNLMTGKIRIHHLEI